MRALVKCPRCAEMGKTRNLAEVLPDGSVKIQRMVRPTPQGIPDYTIIKGLDFKIECGECGHVIEFKERRDDEISVKRKFGVYWETLIGSLSQLRPYSATNQSGTLISTERITGVLSNGTTGLHF